MRRCALLALLAALVGCSDSTGPTPTCPADVWCLAPGSYELRLHTQFSPASMLREDVVLTVERHSVPDEVQGRVTGPPVPGGYVWSSPVTTVRAQAGGAWSETVELRVNRPRIGGEDDAYILRLRPAGDGFACEGVRLYRNGSRVDEFATECTVVGT